MVELSFILMLKLVWRNFAPVAPFCLRDSYAHLHECIPILVGIFNILKKKTTMFTVWCRHAHSDWQSTKACLYVVGKSNIMLPWTYIIVLDIWGKHNLKRFTIYALWIYLQTGEKISTNIKIRKYGILASMIDVYHARIKVRGISPYVNFVLSSVQIIKERWQ